MVSQVLDGIISNLSIPGLEQRERGDGFDFDGGQTILIDPGSSGGFGEARPIHTEIPIASIRLDEPPVLGEPVRQIAEGLRSDLHEFLHTNSRRPSQYGFQARTHESPDISQLLKRFDSAAEKLEAIFNDRTNRDPFSIQVRSAAHRIQSGIEAFVVTMRRMDITDTISERDIGDVLHQCIDLKGFLATNMQQLEMMNAEYRAALFAQAQEYLQGQADRRGRRS
ncbi:MAG: hypothetical protein J0M12_08030 [Deltaproteobacteria bacterium]|nr:hypothetical protein [Deltaproteobacteria bacterium]